MFNELNRFTDIPVSLSVSLSMFVFVPDIITAILLWKHGLSSLSPKGRSKWHACKWTFSILPYKMRTQKPLDKYKPSWVTSHGKKNLVQVTNGDLSDHRKGKVTLTYEVDVDAVKNGFKLLIICKFPLKELVLRLLPSNGTLCTQMSWNKDAAAITAHFLDVNKNRPSGIMLLLPEHDNSQRPSYLSVALRTCRGGEIVFSFIVQHWKLHWNFYLIKTAYILNKKGKKNKIKGIGFWITSWSKYPGLIGVRLLVEVTKQKAAGMLLTRLKCECT